MGGRQQSTRGESNEEVLYPEAGRLHQVSSKLFWYNERYLDYRSWKHSHHNTRALNLDYFTTHGSIWRWV